MLLRSRPGPRLPDPVGLVIAAVARLGRAPGLDRLGLRRPAERLVFEVSRGGTRALDAASRRWPRTTGTSAGRPGPTASAEDFDLTPSGDEQALVDVTARFAADVLRPAAPAADAACTAPDEVLDAGTELGLHVLGVPEELGGVAAHRSTVAGALVAEALAHGDLGLAVAALAPGAVATALALWGDADQQATYLPAFTGDHPPVAALGLDEPRPLHDPLAPRAVARRTAGGYVLEGAKSGLPRGAEAELFVVAASLEGEAQLFLVEPGSRGLAVEADPSMGVRAAGLTRLRLDGVAVGPDALLGDTDSVRDCVRLSRLAWCALGVGTAQAVLDHVVPYVNEREAFGAPLSHRQSVAFMVADIATELDGMRLATWRAASRAQAGLTYARETALARRLCSEHGMRIGSAGVQLLGGHGYVKEHPVERWYRDLRAVGVLEGGVMLP